MKAIPSSRRNPYLSSVALFGERDPGIYWQDSEGMMHLLEETSLLSTKQRDDYLKHITTNLIERDIVSVTDSGNIVFGGYIYDPIHYRAWVMNDVGNFIQVIEVPKKKEDKLEDYIYGILKEYYKTVVTVVTRKSPCSLDPTLLKNSCWDGVWLEDATAQKLTSVLGSAGDIIRTDNTYHSACDVFGELYDYLSRVSEIMIEEDVYAEIEGPANIIAVLEDRVTLIKLR